MSVPFVEDVPAEIVQALGGRYPTAQQWAAIAAPLEPVVVVAGAGSGKTAVMAARIVWLIVNGHANANEILGLTFTNKAAESLLQRVRRALEPLDLADGEEPTIGTYHAFASSLIADYGLRAGIEPSSSLLSEAQAWQLLAELYMSRTYEAMEVRTPWHVQWVRNLADECANHLVEPHELIASDRAFLDRIEEVDKISKRVKLATRKRIELAAVVAAYEEAKDARNMLDYGDQIRLAHRIASDEQVAEDFRRRYRFALLDEYQDTNVAQARMLSQLMPAGFPVMAVGDPDQNIYAWRGASLHNLFAFPRDFARADGSEAARLPLEVNFRSGSRILNLANSLIEGIPAERRPSDKVLRPHEPLGEGEVAIFVETDQVSEAERIADEAKRCHDAGTPWGEMAVLCRKKRLFDGIVEAFRAREIPLEVIGLGGLLKMPEVTDLVSLLRVLEDPLRNVALARLLRGPWMRIGHRDLVLIARHAYQRNADLRAALPGEDEAPGDIAYSLAEALESFEQIEGLSDEARERLRPFVDMLARLRASAHLPLPELVARALDELGLMRELDASPSPAAASARRNLANFLDRVAAFKPLDGEPTLGALVEWLDAIESADEEIEASQPTEDDAVKLMTIHTAKGLEFDLVFVPGLARGKSSHIFPDTSRQSNPATSPKNLPFELRGDAEALPKFMGNLSQFTEQLKMRAHEEERRLLYVAVTRARKRLVCSAAFWYYPSDLGEALKNPMEPSEYWREIRSFPDVEVIGEVEQPEENPLIERRAERARTWPPPARRPSPHLPEGAAAAVRAARAQRDPDPTLFPAEQVPAAATEPVPRGLPVSAVVTYDRCPKRFYWSYVRPLPRRPSAAARIGTLVHTWIERQGRGQITLYDPEEFEEREPSEQASRIADLRAAYERTRFSGRTPHRIEQGFSLVVGDLLVQGRIDAIFEDPDGTWEIVDWKSGRAPAEDGAERWQLDLYALAAQEVWGRKPEELKLTFLYLGGDQPEERTVQARPAEQIRADLERMLASVAAGAFDPVPSAACSHCDFLRDCAAGRTFTGSA